MISLAPGTKVFLACSPIDLRAGFNGLVAKVQQMIGQNPFDSSLYIFRGFWRRSLRRVASYGRPSLTTR